MIKLDTIYNEDCLEGMKRIPEGMRGRNYLDADSASVMPTICTIGSRMSKDNNFKSNFKYEKIDGRRAVSHL